MCIKYYTEYPICFIREPQILVIYLYCFHLWEGRLFHADIQPPRLLLAHGCAIPYGYAALQWIIYRLLAGEERV